MFRNQSVSSHSFAMVPRADVPRASFKMQRAYKTTFDGGLLIPVFCEEVLPGDTFNLRATMFARMATPIFPVMDNMHLDSFFFFVPCRLVWSNWVRMMGEQNSPGDSISYIVPTVTSPVGGWAVGSVYDYYGLPTVGQVGGANTLTVNALPFRAYRLIFHTWFRDQNLQNETLPATGDGPDSSASYILFRRGKRHDYFTSCLPWPLKGGVEVPLPLGTTAPVRALSTEHTSSGGPGIRFRQSAAGALPAINVAWASTGAGALMTSSTGTAGPYGQELYPSNLYADLSSATAATINQLRQSFQIQRLLERDARGGTRYVELIQSHFGVQSPDARLQRPEYLGGSSTLISVNPIAQTSATGVTGGSTPVGTLGAMATGVHRTGFTGSFVEHGYVIGLVSVRADLTYQQGIRKMFLRSTRYDFYWPVFAMLGEQAVLSREIYADGSAGDSTVFGYQERWAEYRYLPSQITGLFRSTAAGTLDPWHFSQRFLTRPVLNNTFIEDNPPFSRNIAVGAAANGAQFLFDAMYDLQAARPMPLYSVPGMIDHF